MVSSWNLFGEAKCRWVLTRQTPVGQVGPPLDCAHPEPTHRQRFRHRVRALPLEQRRGPSSLAERAIGGADPFHQNRQSKGLVPE